MAINEIVFHAQKHRMTKTFVRVQPGDTYQHDCGVNMGAGCAVITQYHRNGTTNWSEYNSGNPEWIKYLEHCILSPDWEIKVRPETIKEKVNPILSVWFNCKKCEAPLTIYYSVFGDPVNPDKWQSDIEHQCKFCNSLMTVVRPKVKGLKPNP